MEAIGYYICKTCSDIKLSNSLRAFSLDNGKLPFFAKPIGESGIRISELRGGRRLIAFQVDEFVTWRKNMKAIVSGLLLVGLPAGSR